MKFWKYEKKNSESSNFDLNLGDDSNENKMSQEDTDSEQSSNGESAANDYQKEESKNNNNSQVSQESEANGENGTSEENELNDEAAISASQNNRNGQITDEKNPIEQSQTEMPQTSESREELDQNKQDNEEDLEESSEPSTCTSQPNKTESNPDESEESKTSGLENSSNKMDETKYSSTELSEDKSLEGATKTPTPESTKAGQDSEKMQSNDLKTQEPESDFSEDKLPSGKSNQNSLAEDNSKKESQASNNSEIESKDDATSEENELARETKKSNKDENTERKNQPLEEQPSKTENNKAASDNSVEEEKKKGNQLSNEETDGKNSTQNPAESHSNNGFPSLQNAEPLEESHDESNHQETIEKLEQLKNIIKKYAKHKEKQEQSDDDQEKDDFSLETNDTPNEENQEKEPPEQNEFLNQLQQELPSFENRSRNDGYSISTNESIELPESLIRTIINKFLNQRFCKKTTDLNSRNHSLEKSKGFYKWEVKDIIVHSKTNQLNKVLDDKYGYEYSEGKSENIPLSFYFDMSCSMSRYSNMLAIIAIELLKKNVKVLIGYNARVNIQLDKVKSTMTLDELAEIIKTSGYYYSTSDREKVRNNSNVKCKVIEKRIDNFLVESHAEKCVVFSDFDPIAEVMRLSNFADVYWFCFEKDIKKRNLEKYQGFLYPVQTAQDIAIGLVKVSEKRFESLIYLDNPENLQRRKKL